MAVESCVRKKFKVTALTEAFFDKRGKKRKKTGLNSSGQGSSTTSSVCSEARFRQCHAPLLFRNKPIHGSRAELVGTPPVLQVDAADALLGV